METYTSIFALAKTVFRAETLRAKEIQNSTLESAIRKELYAGNSIAIKNSLEECVRTESYKELALIEEHFEKLITTIHTNEESINARTDLIIIPMLVTSSTDTAKMLSIKYLEETLQKFLKEYNFIPVASSLNLYSVLFTREKIDKFTLSDWYQIHHRMIFARSKSQKQKIYNNTFGINVTPNKTELFYFVGTILQNKELVEDLEPELFDKRQLNLEDKKLFLSKTNEKLSQNSKTTKYKIIMPDSIFSCIEEARYQFQDQMIHYFINKKSKLDNIEFFLVSLERGLALFAYDTFYEKVLDKMLLTNFGTHGAKENIDIIFESLADNKTYVYISKSVHDYQFYKNSDRFNLKQYLAENEHDRLIPNYIDNSDLYL